MEMHANWSYPTNVLFGAGRLAELPQVLEDAGISRPLLLTDRGLAALPLVAELRDLLPTAPLFSETDPNPTGENLDAALEVFRSGNHDGVVAMGGGSALDLGKAVALMAGQNLPVWDLEDIGANWRRADGDAIAPVIAIPTTAGTGSEVGRASVLTDKDRHAKKIIFHPKMMPVTVIADPQLTVSMPAHITAGTGMDALAHCLEAYCSPHFHPMSQGIALEGMALVAEHLPRAYAEPGDLTARGAMMAAAMMGAVAFQKGLGAVHALSHPIGAIYGTHHGTTNAFVMPYVLRANQSTIAEKLSGAAAYLGLPRHPNAILEWVEALNHQFGIPATLSVLGAGPFDAEGVLEGALIDPSCAGNPVEMTREWTQALIEALPR
ncbi:MAG: iron-containing alcohol dehydrogenase [Pseudomonadota bacterium]